MNESRPARPINLGGAWTVRRAELIDIPAVARLLHAPARRDWPLPAGLPEENATSAARLMLTHLGFDLGEFWVAVDPANRVIAAVVLLPPISLDNPTEGQKRLRTALRLELGLLPPSTVDLADLTELAALMGVPERHWLMLPVLDGDRDRDRLLEALLAAALPAVDATGLPVLSLEPWSPSDRVSGSASGFVSIPVPSPIPVSASLRPGLESPVGV